MPDKTSVAVVFRIVVQGSLQEIPATGRLHRLTSGWALTCRMEASADEPEESSLSDILLVIRDNEIRMSRKGAVKHEQTFRTGEWRQGTVHTPFSTWDAEAYTHRIRVDLSLAGGIVEWEYDQRMAGENAGRSSVTLDIREEQGK